MAIRLSLSGKSILSTNLLLLKYFNSKFAPVDFVKTRPLFCMPDFYKLICNYASNHFKTVKVEPLSR